MRAGDSADLMLLHVGALYTSDAQRRITGINQWDGGAAPRFFLGRTEGAIEWRARVDLPAALVESLAELCQTEPPAPFEHQPRHHDAYCRLLERHARIERIWMGPAYWLGTPIAPRPTTIAIDESTAGVLHGAFDDWLPDVAHRRPFVAEIVDGRAVAVCASVRITEAAHEAGVETAPRHRRRGHGAAAVASWAHAVRRLGALPLYSTSWDNVPSQRLATGLGFTMFGSDFHVL